MDTLSPDLDRWLVSSQPIAVDDDDPPAPPDPVPPAPPEPVEGA